MIMGATLLSRTPWRLHLDIGKSSPGSLPHISGGWARYGYRTRDIIYCAYAFSRKTFNLLGRGCSRLVRRRAHESLAIKIFATPESYYRKYQFTAVVFRLKACVRELTSLKLFDGTGVVTYEYLVYCTWYYFTR